MTRTLKVLGLATLVMGALSAVSATGAQAETLFHCEVEPCTVTGTTEAGTKDKYVTSGFTIECHGSGAGTASHKQETTILFATALSNCNSSLGEATVDTAGCSYVFKSHTNATGHLPVDLSCTTGSAIKVTAPGCTLSFGSQTTTGGVKATNIGSGATREVTVDITTNSTFSKSGSLCFAISGDTGTYTGKTLLKGYEDKGCTGLPDAAWSCSEGAQVGIWWE